MAKQTSNPQKNWDDFVKRAFEAVNLPEVPDGVPPEGCYTNSQVALKLGNAFDLVKVLETLPREGTPDERRKVLSLTVDLMMAQA
jgi:hypothetical protein